ncbi:MAG: methyltransferase [Ignavibacteria bacterium]|nr:methyltransferase [Ignavibacteria bacterium]
MRIIAGSLKHRRIPSPIGYATRPTSDRGRESVFQVVEHLMSLTSIHVIDAYAGTGVLSFEAISRGASTATMIDASADVCRQLRQTALDLGVSESVTIIRSDATDALRLAALQQAHLIFIDPPYALRTCNTIASLLVSRNHLIDNGLAVFEHSDQEHLLGVSELDRIRTIEMGQTVFDIVQRVPSIP